MVHRFVVAGVLAAASIAAACSNSGSDASSNPSISTPPNCTVDGSLACSGSTGFACASGSNPEDADDTLVCSTPVTAGTEDEYCCIAGPAGSDSTCQADDTLVCPSGTFGYSCASGDDPADFDSTLSCSAGSGGDDDGGASVFCCAQGATLPGDDDGGGDGGVNAGCTTDDTITCTGNATGYSCTVGTNPQVVDPTLTCSASTTDAQDLGDYCCVQN
jgi:hypothetical protein